MNDSGLLKDLIENYIATSVKQSSLLITILVFIIVNVLVAVIGFYGQLFLKKEDINVHKRVLRETKRMELFHLLYQKLDSMRSIFNDDARLLQELKDTTKFLNENRIFFLEKESSTATDCCDYFSNLLVAPYNRDILKEKKFLEDLKTEFHK